MALIFKILHQAAFDAIARDGIFRGATIDLDDGYIHFSTAAQVRDTARLHFSGQQGLVLFAVDDSAVQSRLRWEASRGGQIFPHVYGTVASREILWAKPLPWDGTAHAFPPETFL